MLKGNATTMLTNTGMTPKHVDTRIMRAKAKVRKLIEKDVKYNE